jgi:DNA-binding CsgD family transcriptional regulator
MVGDEAELYRTLGPRLEGIVRAQVSAPAEVVEDACHHAWTNFINHSETVERDTALAWLVKTAVRQAWKLNSRERREASLEAAAEPVSQLPGPDERIELRERLEELGTLSERQRRLVWLRAVGLSHVEMAAYTGDTVRTVRRQILRATDRMRELHAERAQAERARADRERAMAQLSRARVRAHEREERGIER